MIDYISHDNLDSAVRIFRKIESKCKTLNQFPERGRIIPELKGYGIFTYHELVVTPWRIMYRISDHKVFVLAVIDSRRNIEDILIERFIE